MVQRKVQPAEDGTYSTKALREALADAVDQLPKGIVDCVNRGFRRDGEQVEKARHILMNPLAGLTAAWHYDQDRKARLVDSPFFALALSGVCAHSVAEDEMTDHADEAQESFLATLSGLVDRWRSEPPKQQCGGTRFYLWLQEHEDVAQQIEKAFDSQRPHLVYIALPDREAAPFLPPRARNVNDLIAKTAEKRIGFIGQRTWRQAGETAARALFGEFLLHHSESIGFCERCSKPFPKGKKTSFCSVVCAHTLSSVNSRRVAVRRERRRQLTAGANALEQWLQMKHRAGADWRRYVQDKADMATLDGRLHRFLGACIRAACTPQASPHRRKLLDSLINGEPQRTATESLLNSFLDNIMLANQREKR